MSRSNFRVKVDLSKYYQDARRFCWVFIDATKIIQISHIKEHITNLFNISEPYHLCLNDADYLPPAEDVRIVKEDETLVVIPGSGLEDEVQLSTNFTSQHDYDNNQETKTFSDREAQTIEFSITKPIVSMKNVNIQSNGFSSDSKRDISYNDVTFYSIKNDAEGDSDIDYKSMDNNITENCSFIQQELINTKLKRKRQRKGKKYVSTFIENSTNEVSAQKKPKVINSVVIPSGKHIRFNPCENNDTELSTNGIDTSICDQYPNKSLQNKELSTLLALRHSSTPLTFTSAKVKREIEKTEDTSDIHQNDMDVSYEKRHETSNNIIEKNISDKETSHKIKNQTISDEEFQLYPLVKNDAQSNDIIGFKMLNFGKDYSPQVSKIIVAQIVSFSSKTEIFTLRVIKGLDEVHFEKVPVGKFSIPEGENDTVITDTININYAQMIEPRFIKRSSTSNPSIPI